jgi:hypothetical protein
VVLQEEMLEEFKRRVMIAQIAQPADELVTLS